MVDKFIYIHNDDTHNYPFCTLQLVVESFLHFQQSEPTNQNSIKVPKVIKTTNKILGNTLINSLISPPSL